MTDKQKEETTVFVPEHNFDAVATHRAAIRCRGMSSVCFDLKNAEWVNSEGIAFMLQLHRAGVSVRIHNPPPLLHRALESLQLVEAFRPILDASPTTEPGEVQP